MKPVATCTSNYVIESLWCPTKLKFIKKFLSNINNNIEINSPYVAHIINICWLSGHHEHRKRNTTEKLGTWFLNSIICLPFAINVNQCNIWRKYFFFFFLIYVILLTLLVHSPMHMYGYNWNNQNYMVQIIHDNNLYFFKTTHF